MTRTEEGGERRGERHRGREFTPLGTEADEKEGKTFL